MKLGKAAATFREERGANLIEWALMLLVFVTLLAGAVDFGRAVHDYIVINNATREGARYASHFPHLGDGIRTRVEEEATAGGVSLDWEDVLINPDPPFGSLPNDPGVAQPGSPIRVTVVYAMQTLTGGLFGLDEITVQCSTEMVVFGLDQ